MRPVSVTVSSRYQVTIPKDVRDERGIQPGQKLDFIVLGGVMHVVLVLSLDELQGIARGIDTSSIRDHGDRY